MELFLLFVAGGAAAYAIANRGRKHQQWRPALEEAARSFSGRASLGSIFDQPELRAQHHGVPVTIRLRNIQKSVEKALAIGDAVLAPGAPSTRIYLGWDIHALPADLHYIPEVPFAAANLPGTLVLRSDDAALAQQFAEHASTRLADLRRAAVAHAVEVLIRGGSIQVAVHGVHPSADATGRLVRVTAELAELMGYGPGDAKPSGVDAGAAEPWPAASTTACELCGARRAQAAGWVACKRCKKTYHLACWTTATGCVADGCAETRATGI